MKYLCLLCAILIVCCCVPVASAVTYDDTDWDGEYGYSSGYGFGYPSGVAVDASDDVYVVDAQNYRVVKFGRDGAYRTEWVSDFATDDGTFYGPVDIAVDSRGIVYVTDDWSNRIKRFNIGDRWSDTLPSWPLTEMADAQFQSIGGLGIDSDDNVYVTDTKGNSVKVFNRDGVLTANWAIPTIDPDDSTQDKTPFDVAVNDSGEVYITQTGTDNNRNNRVLKFTSSGEVSSTLTVPVDALFGAINIPGGITTDARGNVFVTDYGNHTVHMFDRTGGLVTQWGGRGIIDYQTGTIPEEGKFHCPVGIAADSTGNVYVADRENNRVQKFVSVGNVPPSVSVPDSDPEPIQENRTFTWSGSFVDPDEEDAWTATVDYGDGTGEQGLTLTGKTFELSHLYADDDDDDKYTVTVTVTDKHDGVGTAAFDVTVTNVAPTLAIWGAETVAEGSEYMLSLSSDDPGADTITSWEITWGDGSPIETVSGNPSSTSHTFVDGPNRYWISATATDEDGTFAAGDNVGITVNNVAPTVRSIGVPLSPPNNPIRVNTPISANATFSDPGALDKHTIIWKWGDGSESRIDSEGDASGTLINTTTHTYSVPGIYSPSVTVTDNDEDAGTFAVPVTDHIVVYDPNCGSATGGGWFDAPAGKAHFAFVSKYKRDATVPDSSVEFSLKQAKLDFKSTSVKWLLIAGSKATYSGVGTLNGAGEYGFLLSAIDDPSSGDRVRMKIWDGEGIVVYDSQPGAPDASDPSTGIGGGSIVIHP